MGQTSIEWTDHSINPIRARLRGGEGKTVGGYGSGVGHFCEKISPGCANCYASTSQPRFGMPGFPGAKRRLPTLPVIAANGAVPVSDTVEVFFDESRLQEVLNRKKPTKWFWFDQTDAFGSWVPFDWLDKCFAVMALTPHHTHQILTKRPERMAEYLGTFDADFHNGVAEIDGEDGGYRLGAAAGTLLDGEWIWGEGKHCRRRIEEFIADSHADPSGMSDFDEAEDGRDSYETKPVMWPLPNVWLGTSVEDQKAADERIPHLLGCPAAVRFLSAEPLLGGINLREHIGYGRYDGNVPGQCVNIDGLTWHGANEKCRRCGWGYPNDPDNPRRVSGIDWAIIGGESGPGARPCDVADVRSLVSQCTAAGVAVFVKQLGAHVIDHDTTGATHFEPEECWPDGTKTDGSRVLLKDKKGGDWSQWPEDLWVRQFPAPAREAVPS